MQQPAVCMGKEVLAILFGHHVVGATQADASVEII